MVTKMKSCEFSLYVQYFKNSWYTFPDCFVVIVCLFETKSLNRVLVVLKLTT